LPELHVNVQVFVEQPAVARAGVASQQLVPQRVLLQLMSQPELVHTAVPFDAGGLQRLPHSRQFDVSVATLTHAVPQRVRVPQSTTHLLLSHTWP
jgi:hypothetical protein